MPVLCYCGQHNSINFNTHECVDCGRVDKFSWVCGRCLGGYNGNCETCDEKDRIYRIEKDTQELCGPVERVGVPVRRSPTVKQTRCPDRFNTKGVVRTASVDKYALSKRATTNKGKDRALLRRIKFGYDEPHDFRVGRGLTIHDLTEGKGTHSWTGTFAVRRMSKLERENAIRIGGANLLTYGCACLREAWKKTNPNLVAGTSFRSNQCIGCVVPKVRPVIVNQILEFHYDDFSHDDGFYVVPKA